MTTTTTTTTNDKVLVLRTCKADLSSPAPEAKGFKWPEKGAVAAKDWNPSAICGYGLHGALWGKGNGSLFCWDPDAKWLVVEVAASDIVELNGKVKFPSGNVVFCGTRFEATNYIAKHTPQPEKPQQVIGLIAAVGDKEEQKGDAFGATLSGGQQAILSGGDRSTVSGGSRSTVSGGDGSTVSGGSRSTVSGGDRSTVSGGSRSTVSGGDGSTVSGGSRSTVSGGDGSTVKAGEIGLITCKWWDEAASRYRLAVGYVGEDGIEPNTVYRVEKGKFIEVSGERP